MAGHALGPEGDDGVGLHIIDDLGDAIGGAHQKAAFVRRDRIGARRPREVDRENAVRRTGPGVDDAVEAATGSVLGVLAVVDRGEGGRAMLESKGREVVALITSQDLGIDQP